MRSFFGATLAIMLWLGGLVPAVAQQKDGDTVAYVFKPGDTLNGLAGRYLVGGNAAQVVQRLNGIEDATKIRPGTRLKIPTSLLKASAIGAKVAAFSGSVSIGNAKGSAAAAVGKAIVEGQTLITGSPGFLTIAILGGSNVSIPSRSRVKVVRLRKYVLTGGTDIDLMVEQGRAETSVVPMKDANARFQMRTPSAVSAVRGTVFRVGYDGPDAPSLTEVIEGSVAVDSKNNAASALIPRGFGAALPKQGPLLQEELLPAPRVLNAGDVQSGATVDFRLSPISGAKGYRTQIARDAAFLQIFAESVSAGPTAPFTDVPDGSFYVRSMAIAASGLEGLAENVGFRRRLADLQIVRAVSSETGTFRVDWATRVKGRPIYRFQMFTAADRTLPIVDEPGLETSSIALTNLPSGSYVWRVAMQQMSPDGMLETWTEPQALTIAR